MHFSGHLSILLLLLLLLLLLCWAKLSRAYLVCLVGIARSGHGWPKKDKNAEIVFGWVGMAWSGQTWSVA